MYVHAGLCIEMEGFESISRGSQLNLIKTSLARMDIGWCKRHRCGDNGMAQRRAVLYCMYCTRFSEFTT